MTPEGILGGFGFQPSQPRTPAKRAASCTALL